MQIQRIQTVYIFLALVAMVVFAILPYGEVGFAGQQAVTEKLYVMHEYGILIPAVAAAVLLVLDIFLYRNLPFQRTVLTVCMLLALCCMAVVCFIVFKQVPAEGIDVRLSVWNILLPIAVAFEFLGIKGIARDIKLLSSYNRLR